MRIFLTALFAAALAGQVIVVRHRVAPSPSEAWLEGYGYRKELTIPAGAVSADLSNFPVYVPLSGDTDLSAHALADGSDIAFTAADGVTVLPFEIVNGNPGTAAASGAWNWITGPSALRVLGAKDQTWFGYVSQQGYVYAASYDNANKTTASFDLFQMQFQQDDHNQPAFLELRSGTGGTTKHIAAFYQQHNGQALYRVTATPEDLMSLGAQQDWTSIHLSGDTGHAYAAPFQMADGSIWVFFRSSLGQKWAAAKCNSEANLRSNTWNAAVEVANAGSGYTYNYVKATQSADRQWIYLAMVTTHPDTSRQNSLYAAKFDGANLYDLSGTLIGPMGGAQDLASWTRVWTYTDGMAAYGQDASCWIWDIALNSSGNPVVAYTVFPGATETSDPDHRYRLAVWNGSGWIDNEISPGGTHPNTVGPGFYSGGIALDQADPNVVYLSRNNGLPNYVLEKKVTANSGATWTTTTISADGNNYRPLVAWGPAGNVLRLFWLRGTYTSYTNYAMSVQAYPSPARLSWLTEAHARLPHVSAAAPTQFYLYYGNASPTAQQDKATLWSGYSVVEHFTETDLGLYAKDSTETSWMDRRGVKGRPSQLEGAGQVGRALVYANSSFLQFPAATLNIAGDTAMTQMGWIKTASANGSGMIASNWPGSGTQSRFYSRIHATSKLLECWVTLSDGTTFGGSFANPAGVNIADGNWHLYACQYTNAGGVGMTALIDAQASLTTYPGSLAFHVSASQPLYLGFSAHSGASWSGMLDEWRYARSILSPAYLRATYDNHASAGTFLSKGSQEIR